MLIFHSPPNTSANFSSLLYKLRPHLLHCAIERPSFIVVSSCTLLLCFKSCSRGCMLNLLSRHQGCMLCFKPRRQFPSHDVNLRAQFIFALSRLGSQAYCCAIKEAGGILKLFLLLVTVPFFPLKLPSPFLLSFLGVYLGSITFSDNFANSISRIREK